MTAFTALYSTTANRTDNHWYGQENNIGDPGDAILI